MEKQPLTEFLALPGTLFDVRSPSEYTQGHIPGSINFPLFSDEERKMVGTTYQMIGQEEAVNQGLEFVSPRLGTFIDSVAESLSEGYAKVHCWRGGMRSSSVAQLLQTAGFPTVTLEGGYKSFRQWALSQFEKPYHLKVLGGFTGTGKTEYLHTLQENGEQVIDLEKLANHRGSTFGAIGPQPTTEQFQNEMAYQLSQMDPERPVWVEDESPIIGMCHIPDPFFKQMRAAFLYLIERPLEERLEILKRDYLSGDVNDWIASVKKIEKKLGGARTKEVIEHIKKGRLRDAAILILEYYDAAYQYSLSRRTITPAAVARELLVGLPQGPS